jgi:tetratricopeptide (TPR) repeat protein
MQNTPCNHQEITRLRQHNQLDQALAMAQECYSQNPNNLYIQSAYGWVLWAKIKQTIEQLGKANYRDKAALYGLLGNYFKPYFRFKNIHRPELLNSLLIDQLSNIPQWNHFLAVARWFGVDHFRSEDMQNRKTPDGKEYDSIYLRFHHALAEAIAGNTEFVKPELVSWAYDQVQNALKQYPDHPWINQKLSKYYLNRQQYNQALSHVQPLIKRKRNDFWVWGLLGDIYLHLDPQHSVTCYYHAIDLCKQDVFSLSVRELLAKLLAEQQEYPAASYQINEILRIREQHHYQLNDALKALIAQPWYQTHKNDTDLPGDKKVSRLASALIQTLDTRPVKTRRAVIDHHNNAKRLTFAIMGADQTLTLMHNQFPSITELPAHSIIEVDFKEGDERPFAIRPSLVNKIDGIYMPFTGVVKPVIDKPFAFLETRTKKQIFIPPELFKSLSHAPAHSKITVMAITSQDKNSKKSWKAVKLIDNTGIPTHHIVLISESPMTTMGPLLDPKIGAKSATLVASKQQQNKAQSLASTLKKHQIQSEIFTIDDPFDQDKIEQQLTQLKNRTHSGACVNITGGSKPMSFAANEVFESLPFKRYYVHFNDSIIWLDKQQPNHPISDTIQLPHYIEANGFSVVGRSAHPMADDSLSWIKLLLEKSLNESLQTCLSQAQGVTADEQGMIKLKKGQSQLSDVEQICELLAHAKLVKLVDDHIYLLNSQTLKLLQGEWLEQWIAYQLRQIQTKDSQLQDIQLGLKVANPEHVYSDQNNPNNVMSVMNELDVSCLYNNSLLIIECKTGKEFSGAVAQNAINKLNTLKEQLGGVKGKAAIVSLYPLSAQNIAHAASLGIAVIQGKEALLNATEPLSALLT